MTREERELSITYLEGIKEKYIEGEGYERHPLPEYYAIEMSIKALKQESGIRNCSGCKYSKDNHNAGTEECHLCMWENQYTPTTKNDLGVDCISRKAVLDITWQDPSYADPLNVLTEVRDKVRELPSVTPQKPILDKIRAEVKALSPEPTAYDVVDGNPVKDAIWETIADVLQIIDKYR